MCLQTVIEEPKKVFEKRKNYFFFTFTVYLFKYSDAVVHSYI